MAVQFCAEYVRHLNALRRSHNVALSRYQAELGKLNRDVEKMIQAICDGFSNEALKLKFNAAEAASRT